MIIILDASIVFFNKKNNSIDNKHKPIMTI